MDRSRPRTPANLSESIHRQLNMYALAASAAGVGLLALTQSAEAKIIYTPAHRVIGKNGSYPLALNHKLTDFNIVNSNCTQGSRCNSDTYAQLTVAEASFPWAGNAVLGTNGGQYLAAALKAGAHISGARRFIRGAAMVSQCRGICNFSHSGTRTVGPWRNVTNRYLGLKFKINGKFHYGWARLNVKVLKGQFKIIATLTGYAYETIPGKGIIAGQTKGTDDSNIEQPNAALANPIPDIPQPATLGLLALGSPGLAIWLREELLGARQ
jgi:hypothetical protein